MRRIIALLLLVLVTGSFSACVKPRQVKDIAQTPPVSNSEPKGQPNPLVTDAKGIYAITQEDFIAWSDEGTVVLSPELAKIDGQKIKLIGYVGVFSPEDKGYFYLVRSPEITCSFCVGSELADQIILTVYLPKGKIQKYNTSPIEVVGILQLADVEDPDGLTNYLNIIEAQVKVLK